MNEYEMQIAIYNNLLNTPGITAIDKEVSIGSNYADIVYLEGDAIHALELKLKWCTRGLEQAQYYLMFGANYSSVVTFKQRVPKKHLRTFEEHGIGLGFFIPSSTRDVLIGNCHYQEYTSFHFPIEWIIKPKEIPDDKTFTERLKSQTQFQYRKNVMIWKRVCLIAERDDLTKCGSCGKPLSRDCPQCRKDWSS